MARVQGEQSAFQQQPITVCCKEFKRVCGISGVGNHHSDAVRFANRLVAQVAVARRIVKRATRVIDRHTCAAFKRALVKVINDAVRVCIVSRGRRRIRAARFIDAEALVTFKRAQVR